MYDPANDREQLEALCVELVGRLVAIGESLRRETPSTLRDYFEVVEQVTETIVKCENSVEDAFYRGLPTPPSYHAVITEQQAVSAHLLQVERLPHLRAAALEAARREANAPDSPTCLYAIHLDPTSGLEVSATLFPLVLRQARIAGDLCPLGVVAVPAWTHDWVRYVVNYPYGVWERLPDAEYDPALLDTAIALWDPLNKQSPYQRFGDALTASRAVLAESGGARNGR